MRLVPLEPASRAAPASLRIPRTLHHVWLGPEPVPVMAEAHAETWAHHHPGWELRTWRDADVEALRHPLLRDPSTPRAERTAVARGELLLRHGGVHLAGDFECLRSLEPLLEDVDAFAASEDGRVLGIGVLGAVPGHPFAARLLQVLPAALAAHRRGRLEPTVEDLMGTIAAEEPHLAPALRDFGPELFFPYAPDEPHRRHERFGEAYAARHWASSWLEGPVADVPRWRLAVAVDWTVPDPTRRLVRAFADAFGPQDPVELALLVPHEPLPADERLVQELCDALGIVGARCAPLRLESFATACRAPFDVAVVPGLDSREQEAEIAVALEWIAATRALMARHGRPAIAAAYGHATLAGRLPELRRRLDARVR